MIKNDRFKYIGLFINREELHKHLKGERLYRTIAYPHITFAYKPEMIDETLFGKSAKITVYGYENDGENEGFKIKAEFDDPVLKEMYADIAIPHITLSVAEGGASVNTHRLDFKDIEPFEINAVFGGFLLEEEYPIFSL